METPGSCTTSSRSGSCFYDQRAAWISVMQQSIALNASFFNTHRMVRQYLLHSYALGDET